MPAILLAIGVFGTIIVAWAALFLYRPRSSMRDHRKQSAALARAAARSRADRSIPR